MSCYKSSFPGAAIHVHPSPEEIFWGHASILRADLACLRLLLDQEPKWTHYMNLVSSALPTSPAEGLERRVLALEGASMVESMWTPRNFQERYLYKHTLSQR